jgi:hypothetical protein
MRRTHIGLLTIVLSVALGACDDAKKAEAPENEMTALRTEIAALRTEVVALRKAIESLYPARAGDGGETKTAEAEPDGDGGPAAESEPAEDKTRKKKSSGSSGGGGKKDEVRMPGSG